MNHAPYGLYGAKYIDLVSLAPDFTAGTAVEFDPGDATKGQLFKPSLGVCLMCLYGVTYIYLVSLAPVSGPQCQNRTVNCGRHVYLKGKLAVATPRPPTVAMATTGAAQPKESSADDADADTPLLSTAPWYQIFPISLPHLRLYEVVLRHVCVLPYKYRKILGISLELMKLSAMHSTQVGGPMILTPCPYDTITGGWVLVGWWLAL